MDILYQRLQAVAPVNAEDFQSLIRISKTKTLTKNEFWLRSGEIADDVAYIKKGYLRKYYIKEGTELTDYFYLENSFTGDLPSILSNRPSYSFIEAMERTELIVWKHEHLNQLAKESGSIEHLLRKVTETGFVTFYNRTKSFVTQSVKERYDQLILEQPQIFQRATQYHIASYLGITPQHLSRIRASK